jgi:hypothetical protein
LKAGKSSDDSLKSRNLLPFNFAGLIQPPYIPAPLLPSTLVPMVSGQLELWASGLSAN